MNITALLLLSLSAASSAGDSMTLQPRRPLPLLASQVPAIFDRLDLHPLLRIHSSIRVFSDLIPPPTTQDTDRDFFISRGGALTSVSLTSRNHGPFETRLVWGAGTASELARLKEALAESSVGLKRDCEFATPGDVTGPYEVTWYGKGSRRNSFVVVFGLQGTSGLPACPLEIEPLIRAISDFSEDVEGHSNTVILESE